MFDAFLSYSRSDQDAIEHVAHALRARNLKPFLDRWHLAAGQSWQTLLADRLADCRSVVVFVGPGGMGSWQNREKQCALDRHAKDAGFPVIPVLLPGVDDPALDFLGLNTWIDLRGDIADHGSLDALAAAIRGQPPGPADTREDPRARICPYRGLQPFREEDAQFFFGREAFSETLLQKVKRERFLAVVGASGSGKSSVVRAGLIPRLRSGADGRSWDILTIVPGDDPLQALSRAFDPPPPELGRIKAVEHINRGAKSLRDGSVSLEQLTKHILDEQPGTDRLMLVIDQFEGLYTLVPKERVADRERFIDQLLTATEKNAARLSVVVTMRGDFYALALTRRDLSDRLQDKVVNIGPLATTGDPMSELEAVIRKPAEAVSLTFEDGLVEQILKDVGTEPGNLPLLEFLLTELWRARKAGRMTNGAYADLGGVEGAIAARAEETFSQLKPDQKDDARRLMLMLVRPGEGQEDTRSRAAIPDDPELQALVQRFAQSDTRLLVTGEDAVLGRTVEVSHEALIQHWQQLRDWVDENRGQLRSHARVRDRMLHWEKAHQPDDLLLPTGLDLEEGRSLLDEVGDLAVEDVRNYVNASINAENQSIAAIQAAQEAEQRRRLDAQRSRRNLFAAAFAISLILLGLAGWQWNEAREQTKFAEQQEEIAKAERGRAVEAARQAVDERVRAEQQKQIAEAERARAIEAAKRADDERSKAETAQADAEQAREFAELQADRSAQSKNLADSEADRARRQLKSAQIAQARFRASKAQELSAQGFHAKAVALAIAAMPQANLGGWPDTADIPEVPLTLTQALSNLKQGHLLSGHEGGVNHAAFSSDGTRIVTVSEDSTARLWDGQTGQQITVLKGHNGIVRHATFSSDGSRIVTASFDNIARLWDGRTGQQITVLKGHEDKVWHAAFSSDGTRIVTASFDNTARLWDGRTGQQITVLKGHEDTVLHATFSSDGSRIVTASFDNTARLWDGRTGQQITVLKGHEDKVWHAAFSSDGTRIVTTSFDNTARLWDGRTGQQITVMKGHEDKVLHAAFSSDGTRIVTTSADNTARLWDGQTGQQITVLKGHEDDIYHAAFSSDGKRIVTASADNTARLWDGRTGQQIIVLKGHEDDIYHAAFSSDGRRIVTASEDNTARLWEGQTGHQPAVLKSHEDKVVHAAFSSDGTRIVTASADNTARLWDGQTGQQIIVLKGHEDDIYHAAFSSDGRRIVTASADNTARLWDGRTGQQITVLKGHEDKVWHAAFSSDGTRIVTASRDTAARLWDGQTGQQITVLKGHEDDIYHAAFSSDGKRIVTASADNTARLWDGRTGQQITVMKGHEDKVVHAAFSSDGTRIVTTSADNTARLWDGQTGQQITVLKGHEDDIYHAAFSSDGKRIVTASADNTARLWDGRTGQQIIVLKGHEDDIYHAAFSSDGTRIVTASADNTARLWDSRTGQQIIVLKGHEDDIYHAAFSSDGTRIVTVSADNKARLWKAYSTDNALYEAGADVVKRLQPLSKSDECLYYLRTEGCSN